MREGTHRERSVVYRLWKKRNVKSAYTDDQLQMELRKRKKLESRPVDQIAINSQMLAITSDGENTSSDGRKGVRWAFQDFSSHRSETDIRNNKIVTSFWNVKSKKQHCNSKQGWGRASWTEMTVHHSWANLEKNGDMVIGEVRRNY